MNCVVLLKRARSKVIVLGC